MIEKMSGSAGDTLGFKASGTIVQDDYPVLTSAAQAAVDEYGEINLVLDLTDLKWEKFTAWDDDMRFGREYRDKIERMAIVGDGTFEKLLAKLADPFYADEARYFTPEQIDEAWAWARGQEHA
jgi:hypothetical protein